VQLLLLPWSKVQKTEKKLDLFKEQIHCPYNSELRIMISGFLAVSATCRHHHDHRFLRSK
jgi:hypothetical protein